jgi:transcriptional regulator with XRE-family HTH domain
MLHSTGEKIKVLRNVKGFTQEYMAKNLSLSQKAYSKIENNEIEPSPIIIEKIAAIFNVTPEFIQHFSPTIVFNNTFNKDFTGNMYVNQIIQSEEKILNYIKDIFTEMKEKYGNTPPPKKTQKKASPKK